MKKIFSAVGMFALVALGGCVQPFSVDDGKIGVPETVGELTFLDQEWNADERDQFYTTPQGNLIIPYKWFLNLETAESNGNPRILFRGDDNIEKLRYLSGHKTDRNEDRLPVGFTKEKYDTDRWGKYGKDRWGVDGEKTWLGMTCAACHTNQINYTQKIDGEKDKKYKIRIDGAPTLADFMGFLEALNEALRSTLDENIKFDEFANKTGGDKEKLRENMEKVLIIREGWTKRNNPEGSVEDGYARLDAFGSIFNEAEFVASGLAPGTDKRNEANSEIFTPDKTARRQTNAPVSYPFLWGTRWHDWVQWPASAPRVPIARNFTEVVGVFGRVDITEKGLLSSYESSMRLGNLRNLADMIVNLRSPQWPETIFGTIDKSQGSLWARGKKLFKDHCIMCHEVVKRDQPQRRIDVHLGNVAELGTDRVMVENFENRRVDPGALQGRGLIDSLPIFRLKEKDEATAIDLVAHLVVRGVSDDLGEAIRALGDVIVTSGARKFSQEEKMIYKGRPLEGIWATAPYLHNGSVPTLKELLKLPNERVEKFWVGSREFEPVEVGFKYENFTLEEQEHLFKLDTTIPGNGNQGHVYPNPSEKVLEPDEIDALVIYQKSL